MAIRFAIALDCDAKPSYSGRRFASHGLARHRQHRHPARRLLVLAGILSSLIALRFGAPLLLVFLLVGMLAGEAGPGGIKFDDVGTPIPSARSRWR